MLIAPMLPQAPATQAANAAATQAAFAAAASSSASRPLTPAAVTATVAVSGYQPQVAEQRRPVQAQTNAPTTNTKGLPNILPDPEFWRVPDRQVEVPQPQPQAIRQQPVVTPQQTAPFVAQAVAQQTPEAKTQQRSEEPQTNLPGSRKPAALLGKKPGVESSGFGAYAVASQRTVSIDLPASVEAFA